MKSRKTGTLHVAGGLLVLVMITSCFVGSTFAKYTVGGTGSDTARVAKFGVEVSVSGEAFKTRYDTDDTSTSITTTVAASNGRDKLAAPGTRDSNAVTFSITGTPEVAVQVQVSMGNVQDIMLKKGYYRDYTKAPYDGTFRMLLDYYPIAFYLYKGEEAYQSGSALLAGTLADINAYLRSACVSGSYAANTNLGAALSSTGGFTVPSYGHEANASTDTTGVYILAWHWEHENLHDDAADTLLGNLAADAETYKVRGKWDAGSNTFIDIADEDYNLNASFDLSITVTQID